MEDRKLLRYLPRFLRNVPNFGAFVAAAITLLAWLLWLIVAISPFFHRENGGLVLIPTLPVMWLGFSAEHVLARALGFDATTHPHLTYVLLFIFTMVGNVVVVWLLLKFATTILRRLRN